MFRLGQETVDEVLEGRQAGECTCSRCRRGRLYMWALMPTLNDVSQEYWEILVKSLLDIEGPKGKNGKICCAEWLQVPSYAVYYRLPLMRACSV